MAQYHFVCNYHDCNYSSEKYSVVIIIIIVLCVYVAYRNLTTTTSDHEGNIVLGFLNVTQWLLALAFPIGLVSKTQ